MRAASGRLFYGWVVVLAIFVVLAVSAGLGFYSASVILDAAVEELDLSVSIVSGATALFFAISGICGFLMSPLMDRIDIRWFFLTGGVVGGAALAGLSLVHDALGLYVFFAVFGIGFAFAGLVPAITTVTRWFSAKRSVALSVASTGLSFGGIALTPIASGWIDTDGLSEAATRMGVFWFLGIVPIAALLVRSRPSDLGLNPDGNSAERQAATNDEGGASFDVAIRSRFFVAVSIAYVLVFLAQVGALAQLFRLSAERVDRATAATVIATMAFASIVGRLIGGLVVLRVNSRTMTGALIVVQGAALAFLAFAADRGQLLTGAALLGLSVGNLLMLQPLIIADAFGVRAYSRIYSLSQLAATAGVAAGPVLLGVLRDSFDYEVAFLAAAAANVAAAVFMLAAGTTSGARSTWLASA